MKTILTILSIAFLLSINSCKKSNDSVTVPPPVTIADTLSAGWKKIIVDSSEVFADIFFGNATTGYLLGNKVRKSTDGGLTWNIISNKSCVNSAVTKDGKLFLVDFSTNIYRSADGGATITNFTVPAISSDAFFTDNLNGFTITNNGLYNTTDGGISWNRINTTGLPFAPNYSSLFFSNNTTGIVVSNSGVFKTNGSLTSWVPALFTGTLPTAAFFTVFITPNGNVYLGSLNNELYRSTDGGATFSLLKVFSSTSSSCDIHFVDDNTGYYSTQNRIYKTTDGGLTWTVVVALAQKYNLFEIHFTDANHGWACGSNGVVLLFN